MRNFSKNDFKLEKISIRPSNCPLIDLSAYLIINNPVISELNIISRKSTENMRLIEAYFNSHFKVHATYLIDQT